MDFASSFVVLLVGYFLSDFSRVKAISVEGNDVYSKDYIVSESGLTLDTIYYLFSPKYVAYKIGKNDLVKSVNVTREGENIVLITIKEKTVVASYQKDDLMYLLDDGSSISVTQSNLGYMAKVPFIVGLENNEELLEKLAKNLGKINEEVLEMMSEIVWYPLSYDETQLQINMIDQNYVYVTVNDIDMINDYRKIASTLNDSGQCVYFESAGSHAYTSECLFNLKDEEIASESDVASTSDVNVDSQAD